MCTCSATYCLCHSGKLLTSLNPSSLIVKSFFLYRPQFPLHQLQKKGTCHWLVPVCVLGSVLAPQSRAEPVLLTTVSWCPAHSRPSVNTCHINARVRKYISSSSPTTGRLWNSPCNPVRDRTCQRESGSRPPAEMVCSPPAVLWDPALTTHLLPTRISCPPLRSFQSPYLLL